MASRTMSSLLLVFAFLALLLCNPNIGAAAAKPELPRFDSIYQLGDSISDTGNLLRESHSLFCSVSPYGETLSNKPTGRCSDGLLMIDFFARAFNLPLLNPYLEKYADFTHGVNFAVAGATALNASNYPGAAPTNSSLPVQLRWFRSHLNSTCSSSSDCKLKLERSLFMVGEVGGNDYNYAFLMGKSIQDVVNMVPDVVQSIVDAANEVIKIGAKQVVVPGNFPIGCMPIYRSNFASNDSTAYDSLGCLKNLNQFASFHNEQLKQAIQELQKQHPNVAVHYGDYYSALTWILGNAGSLGFDKEELFTPCCGNGKMSNSCGSSKGFELCQDPAKRISWDGIHLTQEAYRNLAHWLLSDIFLQTAPAPSSAPSPAPAPSSGAHLISIVPIQALVASFLAFWTTGSKLL